MLSSAAAVAGEELPELEEHEEISLDAVHQEQSKYQYCTVFMVEGEGLDADALETRLEQLGDSLLVVGDPSALKIHVHTDDPGAALSAGAVMGALEGIEIANMHRQTAEREERLLHAVPDAAPQACEVVAVVAGEGNRALFESLGASRVVEGGQSMNPAAADLLGAVDGAGAGGVILLPNNSNVLLAAEHAAANADRPVHVVAVDSIPGGLAAMVSFDGQRTAAENAAEMREAVAAVDTGEVTIASRNVEMNGVSIHEGDWLGLFDGEPIAGGTSFDEVAGAVVDRLLDRPRDLLTLLVGEEAQPLDGLLARIASAHPDVDVDVQLGGQPHYHLLLSAE
jgi:dihydroxyacetone kinase-like predicted kinase